MFERFTDRARRVLELSLREALQLGHNYIGTEHILLGLIREGEGVAAQVLTKLGADLSRVRQQVIQLLSGYSGSGSAGQEGSRKERASATTGGGSGDSASGSITKTRDIKTQAVFSLRGKPLNSFGLSKKVVYENEEFNLLQAALNIEQGIDELRYNKIVIATDADVDGMHIRLLLITFFLQFFPELVKEGHVYVLETPLFRVRNKKETYYCYSDEEKQVSIEKAGKNVEITRFKGLGEISPNEFKNFIGKDIRLEPVILGKENKIHEILTFFMGKNTIDRQKFIIENLRVEEEIKL